MNSEKTELIFFSQADAICFRCVRSSLKLVWCLCQEPRGKKTVCLLLLTSMFSSYFCFKSRRAWSCLIMLTPPPGLDISLQFFLEPFFLAEIWFLVCRNRNYCFKSNRRPASGPGTASVRKGGIKEVTQADLNVGLSPYLVTPCPRLAACCPLV